MSFRECFYCDILQPATWLCSHQLRDAKADHHRIGLADKTPRCNSSSVRRHIDTYLMMPCAICGYEQHNGPVQYGSGNIVHAERPRLKPGSWKVGSEMRFLLATEAGCHSSVHWDAVSTGERSDQIGFLEVRRGGSSSLSAGTRSEVVLWRHPMTLYEKLTYTRNCNLGYDVIMTSSYE